MWVKRILLKHFFLKIAYFPWPDEPLNFSITGLFHIFTCPQVTVSTLFVLTHWGGVTHICVSNQTIIGSDNGLSPDRRQAIIWTNAGILLIGPLGTNFSEISIEILTFPFKKMRLKVSSAKRRPFCLGLDVLTHEQLVKHGCVTQYHSYWSLCAKAPGC